MKYISPLFGFLLFAFTSTSFATHIVGGEFELVHLNDDYYTLNLIIYFDEINGSPNAKDYSLRPFVFRKSDDSFVEYFYLPRVSEVNVPYTNPVCTYGGLETSRILYSNTIQLPAERYNEPEGYYIVWERCCRNSTISNLIPPIDDTIGQTFYLEFPAVVKEGEPFINSSPVLFPPLSDYACLGVDYYVDFAGTDPDGDSLVYSLVTPLNSSEPQTLPTPKPRGSHPGVPWVDGIDSSNMVPGNPPLNINAEGLLRVTPSQLGLFVFAALCEEYRDGVKIGEVRRDFQMLVIDCPPQGNPPSIAYKLYEEDVYLKDFKTIHFPNTLVGDERCIEFMITDPDVTGIANLRVRPTNFSNTPVPVYNIAEQHYNANGDTLFLKVCFTECPAVEGAHYIDFIGNDNSCPLPKMDTVQLAFTIEPLANERPLIQTDQDYIIQKLYVDSLFTLEFEGSDPDHDFMEMILMPVGFDGSLLDFSLTNEVNEAGYLKSLFTWDLSCNQFGFTNDSTFLVHFILDDLDACDRSDADTLTYQFDLKQHVNQAPYFLAEEDHYDLVVYGDEILEIALQARDAENDPIYLRMQTDNFDKYNYDIYFDESYNEAGLINQIFYWNLRCEQFNIQSDSVFNFSFIVNDYPECQNSHYTPISYSVLVKAPRNEAPYFEGEGNVVNHTIFNGSIFELNLKGRDKNEDYLYLNLYSTNFNFNDYDITYSEISNVPGAIDAFFRWEVSCEFLSSDPDKVYEVVFLISDTNSCLPDETDTLKLNVKLNDIKGDFSNFEIPNVITPNGDSKNDYFEMCKADDFDCVQKFVIPDDDCESQFLGVEVYNRWGRRVFIDDRRDFRWDGSESPGGAYYYVMRFTKREYKGTLTIIHD